MWTCGIRVGSILIQHSLLLYVLLLFRWSAINSVVLSALANVRDGTKALREKGSYCIESSSIPAFNWWCKYRLDEIMLKVNVMTACPLRCCTHRVQSRALCAEQGAVCPALCVEVSAVCGCFIAVCYWPAGLVMTEMMINQVYFDITTATWCI